MHMYMCLCLCMCNYIYISVCVCLVSLLVDFADHPPKPAGTLETSLECGAFWDGMMG